MLFIHFWHGLSLLHFPSSLSSHFSFIFIHYSFCMSVLKSQNFILIMPVLCIRFIHDVLYVNIYLHLHFFHILHFRIFTLLIFCFHLRISVSGRVDHRHLHTRTYLVVQGVRTLHQWPSLPKTGTIWRSYCHELDVSQPTSQANTPTTFRHIAPRWGRSAKNERQGQKNSEVCQSTEVFSHLRPTWDSNSHWSDSLL